MRDMGDDEDRPEAFAAVVLSGGTARRLGGVDKAALQYAGRSLLEHALAALGEADEVVVVGPTAGTGRPVTFVHEEPPLGGPAAGLLAGRAAIEASAGLLGLLAVDMPRVSVATFRRLRRAAVGHEGAILVDASGRRHLAGVLLLSSLDALHLSAEESHGLAMHRLLARFDLAEVAALGDETHDVDTWADLAERGPHEPPET